MDTKDPSDEDWEIARRFKRARKEAGLTQVQAAAELGASQRSVQAWENAETIPYRWMDKIESVYGKPADWFFGTLHSASDSEVLALMLVQLDLMREGIEELVGMMRQVFRLPPPPTAEENQLI